MTGRNVDVKAGGGGRDGARSARRLAALVRRIPSWAALGALIVLSTGLRGLASRSVVGPWISPDETVYSLLGQSLYRDGTLSILGEPTAFYSLVVPALVGPFLSFHDLALGYAILKPFQAFVMSLAAVPVYCWARSVVSRGWALAAAALTVAVPGLVYSGLVMSEVAFYPILTLAAWAIARAIAEPTPRRQAILAAAVTLAVLTRLQALVLLPVVIGAVIGDAVFARSWRRALRSLPGIAGLALLLGLWQLVQGLRGEPLLGAYDAAQTTAGLGSTARFVLYHAGDVALMTGVVPLCALLALGLRYLVRGESEALPRATVATGLALSAALIVQVGVFASRHVGQLAERDLLALTPTLLVCFALWLGRGRARTTVTAAIAAIAAAGAVWALPLRTLVTASALPDAVTLAPLWRLANATSAHALTVTVMAVAATAAVLFVVLPRRWLAVLPALLLVAAVAASISASSEVAHQSRLARLTLVGPDPRWIDRATSRPVTYAFSDWSGWPGVWQALFWNRRIAHVVTTDGYRVPGPVPQRAIAVDPTGRIAVDDPGLIFPYGYAIAGTAIAETPQLRPGQAGLRLWQLDLRPRVLTQATGLQTNGDIYPGQTGRLVAYGCGTGTWGITLLVKETGTIALRQDTRLLRSVSVQAGEIWRGEIPALPPPVTGGLCELEVSPSGLLGTTRFEFVRIAEPTPRVLTLVTGLKTNGDIYAGETGRLVAYGCGTGTWGLTLLVKETGTIALRQDTRLLRSVSVQAGEIWRGEIPALPPPVTGGPCELEVSPSGLLGTTRFEFVRKG